MVYTLKSRGKLHKFTFHVWRHFRVNAMLTRDSVKSRLSSDKGISFIEFSYQLFQVSYMESLCDDTESDVIIVWCRHMISYTSIDITTVSCKLVVVTNGGTLSADAS